mgnify:FL=1
MYVLRGGATLCPRRVLSLIGHGAAENVTGDWLDRSMTQPAASSYELRGRWIPDRGLMLWIRDVAGGEVVGRVEDLPDAAFPALITTLISRVPVFRHSLPFTTVDSDGHPRSQTVPCLVISAGAALNFLTACNETACNEAVSYTHLTLPTKA